PWLATRGLVPGREVSLLAFDAQSHWVYYVAQQHSSAYELVRVDVSGREPAPPQGLKRPPPPDGSVWQDITPSHDWSRILYLVKSGEPSVRELYLVDVAGLGPGAAMRINAPLAPDIEVMWHPRFSRDDSVVLYREGGPTAY